MAKKVLLAIVMALSSDCIPPLKDNLHGFFPVTSLHAAPLVWSSAKRRAAAAQFSSGRFGEGCGRVSVIPNGWRRNNPG
jgi:hypothetical protein